MIYEVSEDSFFLGKFVKKLVKGKVLEVGCGSGVLMEMALKNTNKVEGVDINDEAVEFCLKKKLNVKKSDLFSNVEGKFDFIIFNPPYLPQDESLKLEENLDLFGGDKGYEIVERFFLDVENYLMKNGKILILFSNLTNKEKVDEIIKRKFKFEELESKGVGLMEKLYVYLCHG